MSFFSNFYTGSDLQNTYPQNILSQIELRNLAPKEPIEAIMGLDSKGFALLTSTKLIYGSIIPKKPEKDFWHEFKISELTINSLYKNLKLKVVKDGQSVEFKKVNASQKDIDKMYEMAITKIDPTYKDSIAFVPKNCKTTDYRGLTFKEFNKAKKSESARQEVFAQKERIVQLDRDGVAYCPKCQSTSLTAHKKGFGIGKAMIGAAVFLPLAVAGNIGAKKVRVTCLKCGHQFWAGKK